MIEFSDVSLWQSDRLVKGLSKDACIAVKASEGASIQDPKFLSHIKYFADKPVIAYHFCRFDKSTPSKEADKFLSVCKKAERPLILALDFESPCKSNKKDLDALTKMISIILTKTGKDPYVYINESMLRQAKNLGYNFPWLWIAKWSKYPPVFECGIWQYTNRRGGLSLDGDYFMVDDIELLKRHEVLVK